MQGGQLRSQDPQAVRGDAVGAAAFLGWERFDPALLLQTGDGSVERSGSQACTTKVGNVFDHGVSVLGTAGEAGQNEQRRVRVMAELRPYYVSRTTHNVVIA